MHVQELKVYNRSRDSAVVEHKLTMRSMCMVMLKTTMTGLVVHPRDSAQ